MLINLLVVLCGTEEAAPVINPSTLYTWRQRAHRVRAPGGGCTAEDRAARSQT
jgi:hypothetical protein